MPDWTRLTPTNTASQSHAGLLNDSPALIKTRTPAIARTRASVFHPADAAGLPKWIQTD